MLFTSKKNVLDLLRDIENNELFKAYPMDNGENFCWSKLDEGFRLLLQLKIALNDPNNLISVLKSGYKISFDINSQYGTLNTSKGIITFIYPLN